MHTARLPPDLLWLEWFQGRRPETWDTVRGRPLYVYHANLLDHIGALSSFAVRPARLPFPRCYDSMAAVWSIHAKERFNVSPPPPPTPRCRACSVCCRLRHCTPGALGVQPLHHHLCHIYTQCKRRSVEALSPCWALVQTCLRQAAAVTTSCACVQPIGVRSL